MVRRRWPAGASGVRCDRLGSGSGTEKYQPRHLPLHLPDAPGLDARSYPRRCGAIGSRWPPVERCASTTTCLAACPSSGGCITTDLKGEGFVYKPASINPGLQPALQRCGRDYLRIIYGIDYLGRDLPRAHQPQGERQRRVALLEASLGRRIIAVLLRGLSSEHARCVSRRVPGNADGSQSQIDATLAEFRWAN